MVSSVDVSNETRLLPAQSPITETELRAALRQVDRCALLVRPRMLRRVIREHYRLGGFSYRMPHQECLVIQRQSLLEIVDHDELPLDHYDVLPERLILIAMPDDRRLARLGRGGALLYCWRLLYHARIHDALEERFRLGQVDGPGLRRRIWQLGFSRFDEIRAVLQQEHLLLPPRDDRTVYIEFAALYCELRFFAPELLEAYFPGIEQPEVVESLLAEDIDAEQLLAATRLPGAPDPQPCAVPELLEELIIDTPEEQTDELPAEEEPSEHRYRKWLRRAQREAAAGNVVAAAIYQARAARYGTPRLQAKAYAAMKSNIGHLVHRLGRALELRQQTAEPWQNALYALMLQAPRGIWTAEARLLYDLQKVCVDAERELFTVDAAEWLRRCLSSLLAALIGLVCHPLSAAHRCADTLLHWAKLLFVQPSRLAQQVKATLWAGAARLFGHPIKRPLPNQRDLLMCKHLRSAARRLAAVRLRQEHRERLGALISEATGAVEQRVRERFAPVIVDVLHQVGLRPQNVPERVAFDKIIAQLLDQIAERGFLTIGHLRDAISQNNLKMPDLAGLTDILRGDQILRANNRLAIALDGVYRRGEFYLRWMQRLSALAFGTALGRMATRWLIIPFGGSFLVLKFLEHTAEWFWGKQAVLYVSHRVLPGAVALLGLLVLGLLNFPAFRHRVWTATKFTARQTELVLWNPCLWLSHTAAVQQLFYSRWSILVWRFLLKPAVLTAGVWFVIAGKGVTHWRAATGTTVALFLSLNLLLNSRTGRALQETLLDWAVQTWLRYGWRLLSGLLLSVVDLFSALLENIERLLYAVDEWLRFRSGESRFTLVLKGIFGLFWFGVTYFTQFCVTVLIEPQINPVKHFPVVTVSHKILLPTIPFFARRLRMAAAALGYHLDMAMAVTIVTSVIWAIPGVFGFLFWELRGNWRLYAANRPKTLKPAIIGHHGERLSRLLRWGFHSGTIPKLFAKLRRAQRRAIATGNKTAAHKCHHALEHVELAMRRFVQRELIGLLAQVPGWKSPLPQVKRVQLSNHRVRIDLACDTADPNSSHYQPLQIIFQLEGGWLVADIAERGWAERLSDGQAQILATALRGFFKAAGVDILRQQLVAQFPEPVPPIRITPQGLVVWPDEQFQTEVLYRFNDHQQLAPELLSGPSGQNLPVLSRCGLLFREEPLLWEDWVAAWQNGGVPPEQTPNQCGTPEGTLAPPRSRIVEADT